MLKLVEFVARLIQSFEKRFLGTSITLAALWGTDHLAELPKYTNYAYAIGLVVIVVGIWGRKRGWSKKYRRLVSQVDSWLLGGIGLLILGISAENQLNVFDGSGLSWFNFGVTVFLVLGIMLPTPIFMLADWIGQTESRIQAIESHKRDHTILDIPGATLLHPPDRWQRARALIRKLLE